MWYTDICPPYIRISTKHNGPYKGFIRASNTYPGPPTREHKSLLNNAIRLDGIVFVLYIYYKELFKELLVKDEFTWLLRVKGYYVIYVAI